MKRRLIWALAILVALGLAVFLILEGVVLFHARDDLRGQSGAMVILGAQLWKRPWTTWPTTRTRWW